MERINPDDEWYRLLDEFSKSQDKINEAKSKFAKNYLKENPQDVCKKCYMPCNFIENHECGYIGLAARGNSIDDFYTERIPKGYWDETFVELTDEEIKGIDKIF